MPSVGKRGKRRMVNEINVVPYIDVMLVLLVIFMVTAPLIPLGIIDLPSVGKTKKTPDGWAEIQVLASGRFVLKTHGTLQQVNQEVTRKGLSSVIDEVHGVEPDLPFSISGERKVPYGDVMNVYNELRDRGVAKIAFTVKNTSE
jgi:biopolymer transport protein TolR